MARYLCIGAGFLGTNLALRLAQAGHSVTLCSPSRPAHAPLVETAGVTVEQAALKDRERMADLVRRASPDAVLHLASSLIPSSSVEDFLRERESVLSPTWSLAEFLAEQAIKLVFVSSGGTVYGSSSAPLLSEDAFCAPISYYGQAKVETESMVHFLHRTRGLEYLILRPSNPYGRFQNTNGAQGVISVVLGALRDGRGLDVWGDGLAVRDYIHVEDFCGCIEALLAQGVSRRTLNIGSGAGHTLLDVVAKAERVTGRTLPLTFKPARRVDVPRVVLDVTALKELGAWQSRTLDEGLTSYAAELGLTRA